MAYSGIKSYAKPHGSGQSNGGSIIQVINKGGANNFDPNYVNINTLEAHNGNIDNLRVNSANIDNAQINYIMSPNGIINKVQGDELDYAYGNIDELASSNINTTKLTVKDEANIKNLINEYLKTNKIDTDYLTVNKSAHFFELVVDKIRSVQGTQMNTAANCVIDYVEAYDRNANLVDMTYDDIGFYRIYWKNTDDDGRTINNEWLPFDQAICSTFNVKEGTTQNASNKFYWRLVNGTDNGEVRYINFKTGEVKPTKPETFEINFTNGFQYGVVNDKNNYTNFTASSNNVNNPDEYIPAAFKWRPSSTLYGIQVVANHEDHKILAGGGFIFNTDIPTKLNVGVYYDDGTYDYFQGQEYTTSYNIITAAKKNAEAFIICTAELDKWESCNWIDLSNTIATAESSIPEVGDNLCQLGYRYLDGGGDKSRASAIIIAAYETPDKEVVPPSYAQYQDIQDFNLESHRGTYFDATGAYIKGNLVSGTVIEPGVNIPIVVDTWKIVADYSIITKDNENQISPSTITLALLHNNGQSSSIVTSLPSDKAIYVNGSLNAGGLTVPVTSFENLTINLTDTANEQIFDKIIIETFDINATNGTDGVDGTNAFNNVFTYDKTDVTVTVSGQTLSEITSALRVNIDNLKMVHIENGTPTDVNFFAKGYTLCLDVVTFNPSNKKTFISNASTNQLWTVVNGTTASIHTDNLLTILYPSQQQQINAHDYFKLQESANDLLPVQLVIYMLDEHNVQCTDKLRIDINMQAGYINQMTEAGLYQAFFGSYTKDGQTVNGMSSITATMEGISTNVQSISDTVSEHSAFIQESGKFQTTITKKVNDLDGNVTSMQSQITQLPDQIKAEVNDGLESTGIDITNGSITLNAENTVIDGNLNIHNANEGLIIYDNETEKPAITIIGDELGTINTPIVSPIAISAFGIMYGSKFTFPLIDLGTYEEYNVILISALKIKESKTDSTIGTLSFNIDILKNNTSVLNKTGLFVYNQSDKIWEQTQSPIQYTVPSGGGHYYLSVSVEATNSQVDNRLTLNGNGNVEITKLNKISKNGVVFKNGNDKQVWIGEDAYRLQWGNSYIELNDNGVQYKPKDEGAGHNHTCAELGSIMNVKNIYGTSSYYATLYEGMLIISEEIPTDFKLYLPAPVNAKGKYYFIKNLSGHNITLTSDYRLPAIIDTNTATPVQTKTISKYYSTMIFCDGTTWMLLK